MLEVKQDVECGKIPHKAALSTIPVENFHHNVAVQYIIFVVDILSGAKYDCSMNNVRLYFILLHMKVFDGYVEHYYTMKMTINLPPHNVK